MKKLLGILGTMTLIGTTSSSVVACGGENPTPPAPDTRTDITDKITNPIVLEQLSANTKADFLAKLQIKLGKITNLKTITISDYDVYKAGTTTDIQDSDITAGNSLNIKIVAKGANFKGTKDNITVNYTKKDTRTDITDKIPSPIVLEQLSANTKADFLEKLQTKLGKITNLNTITISDYDVYKAGTTTDIQDSDITAGNSLNIKIVAKGANFKGTKDNITVNYTKKDTRTDITDKITNPIVLEQLSANTKADFLAKLQIKLGKITNLKTITISDYDVYKAGTTTDIQDSDITAGNSLNIKIVAKGANFKGTKDNITVNYTKKDTRTDITDKIPSPIVLEQLSANTKADFLEKLQTKLGKITNLNTITISDYDVYKAGTTTDIQDSDITAGNSLNIKIVAKGANFKGTKDNITVNYTKKDTRTDITDKITNPIVLEQLSANTKADFLAKLQIKLGKITNLKTITISDYDVYKAGTTTDIQDSDITAGNSLNIKIVAKGANFKGTEDNITVNYTKKDTRTDITDKITNPIVLEQLSANTKADFLEKLQTKLGKITNLKTITISDYDVYKAGTTTDIQDSDITAGNSLNIKIVAKGANFKGTKDNITVNYTKKDTRTDITDKITNPIVLEQLSANTKADFLAKLQIKLGKITNLKTITISDYLVYKAGTTTDIQDSDITAGNSLNIKIVAKGANFKGTKDNITVKYTKKDTRTDITDKIPSPIVLEQLSANTKADFLEKLQTKLGKITNLNTITISDYLVYKAGTTTDIQDSDITAGNSLNIKIVAKGANFKGTKDNITVNYTKKDTRAYYQTLLKKQI